MNAFVKKSILVSTLVAASFFAPATHAQEVAMVYASNITVTNTLSQIDTTLTPEVLAKEFSKELTAELNSRLPQEQAELSEALRLKDEFTQDIIDSLDSRLLQEFNNLNATVSD